MKRFLQLLIVVLICLNSAGGTFVYAADYDDYVPGDKPENMIANPFAGSGFYPSYGGIVVSYDESELLFEAKDPTTMGVWNPCGAFVSIGNGGLNSPFEIGGKYVLYAHVRNAEPEIASNVDFAMGIGKWSTVFKEMKLTGGDWYDYKEVVIAGSDPSSLQFGFPHTDPVQGGAIAMDLTDGYEPYVAKAEVYDIKNVVTSASATVEPGSSISLKASIVNQIGTDEYIEQGTFNWKVLNAERTAIVKDGFDIVPSEDTNSVTVNVGDNVAYGEYVVLAVSDKYTGYQKGADITVGKSDISNQIILRINQNEMQVFGKAITNDVPPIIVNERTMLPARFIAESLGADVNWYDGERKVVIANDVVEIVIFIDSATAEVNGEAVALDSPAFIKNDRTYLPVRFICEKLGASVEWENEMQKIIITKGQEEF